MRLQSQLKNDCIQLQFQNIKNGSHHTICSTEAYFAGREQLSLRRFLSEIIRRKNSYKCESWMFPALPHFRHSCRKLCVVSLPWVTPDPAAALMSLALLAVGAPSEFSWPLTLQLVCLWIVPDSWIKFNFYSFFKLSPVCVFSRNSLCPGAHNHTTSNRFS